MVDNDHAHSVKSTVEFFKGKSVIDINYYCEPEQNISLARNRAVQNAYGNFVAFIDDDEFPFNNWLLFLYKALNEYKVDGVLGPIKPHYENRPPKWIIKGKFYEKPYHKTGSVLQWQDTRTSNVLLKRTIFDESDNLFNPAFGSGGEDRDFFRRLIEKDNVFLWCNEAPVYETVQIVRYRRIFMLKRALLRGKVSLLDPSFNVIDILKSFIVISLCTLTLP